MHTSFAIWIKTIWILVVILVGLIGMIIYYAVERSQRFTQQDNNTDTLNNF